jgi:hypothetical protein
MKTFSESNVKVLYAPENAERVRGVTRDMLVFDDWSPYWGAVFISFFTPKAVSVYPNYQALEDAVKALPQEKAVLPITPAIYGIQAFYSGPRTNFPDDSERGMLAQQANIDAENKLIAALMAIGMTCYHQYSWPDGSLYKWATPTASGPTNTKDVMDALNAKLAPHDMSVELSRDNENSDPYKIGYKTLREYVNDKRNIETRSGWSK